MIKSTYLLQRAKTRNFDDTTIAQSNTGDYLNLEYMGAAEFEFGAIPQMLRNINTKMSNLITGSVTHKDMTLYFLCEKKDIEDYSKELVSLIEQTAITKRGSGIHSKEILYKKDKKKTPIYNSPEADFQYNVWLDLSNDLIIARDPKILENLRKTVSNSVKFMDSQKSA